MSKKKQTASELVEEGSGVKENEPPLTDPSLSKESSDTAKEDITDSKDDNGSSITMAAATTAEVTATLEPENASNPSMAWSSDDEDIATVTETDNPATITAVAAGSCTVTVTTNDGTHTDTIAVTVT